MLDEYEKRIINGLQAHGRIPNVELARDVGLSESPCLRRVRALEASGVITGYAAQVNHKKVGIDVVAYIQLHLDQRSEDMTEAFLEAVRQEPQIVECYAMSGSYDYLLKVVAKDLDEYSDLAMHRVLKYPGVKDITSAFALKDVKKTHVLPL